MPPRFFSENEKRRVKSCGMPLRGMNINERRHAVMPP